MSTVSGGGDKQDVVADHQAHQATVEQRTRDSNISNDVKTGLIIWSQTIIPI